MQTFTIRDLRDRSGELSREAEQGRLSLVTRHGQPLFISVPFTDEVMRHGLRAALATHLFRSGELTPGRAAQIAGMSYAQFLEHASAQGVAVVDYDPAELDRELNNFEDDGAAPDRA